MIDTGLVSDFTQNFGLALKLSTDTPANCARASLRDLGYTEGKVGITHGTLKHDIFNRITNFTLPIMPGSVLVKAGNKIWAH